MKKIILSFAITFSCFASYAQTVSGWDAAVTAQYSTNNYHLIGVYQGWDADAVYIAGYNNFNNSAIKTKRVIMGGLVSDLEYHRIGIGTTTPNAPLQIVRGGTNATTDYPAINITTSATGNLYGPIIYLNGLSGNGGRQWGLVSSGALDAPATGAAGNFAIYDANSGARLIINSLGNVGIGTISPDAAFKLSVNGKIRTKEVRVETGWADYVFDKDYKLKSIPEVENFINANHHLPDVPSAAEVEKNGVALGETSALLLKKIEELTLYLIEKDKQLENQTKVINDLKKSQQDINNKLEKLLNQPKQ